MTDITAHIQSLIGQPAPPGSTIEFFRPELSGVRLEGTTPRTLTAQHPAVYKIVDGQPSPPITGLPGGPVHMRIKAGPFRRTYRLVLPESGTVDLWDLLEQAIPWEAPVLHEGREMLAQMRQLRDQTFDEIAASKQVDVTAKARRDRILDALDAGGHRPVRILSIGDDWAEAAGQSSPEFGIMPQFAEQFHPGRTAAFLTPMSDGSLSFELLGNEIHGPATVLGIPKDFPAGRIIGPDTRIRIFPGATRRRFVRLYWAQDWSGGSNAYAETVSWRRYGETAWNDVDSWAHGSAVWDRGFFSVVVDVGTADSIEVSSVNDPTGRPLLFLGATLGDSSFVTGVEVFDLGWTGTDLAWWASRLDAWGVLREFIRYLNPDIIHISSIYFDIDGGLAEGYEPAISACIQKIRGLCAADIPVLGTIRPLPDIVHPDWATGGKRTRWDAYRAGFTTMVGDHGGLVVDFDQLLGPMSGLSLATMTGTRMNRTDRGLRSDAMHLSNLGATRAARLAANLVRDFE